MNRIPATPLPWLHDVPPHDWSLSAKRGQHQPQDFFYARHAANAYPRLVEALRWHITGKGSPDLNGNKGRDLLRELGEL